MASQERELKKKKPWCLFSYFFPSTGSVGAQFAHPPFPAHDC
jgi:hypothetical protein